MRRALLVLALLTLLAPAAARAHGSIAPTAAPAGGVQRFVLTVPATLAGGPPVIGVTLTLPPGVAVESAEASQPRWSAQVSGQTITWTGGPIEGFAEDFAFRARMPDTEGTYTFTATETYSGGVGPPFALAVTATRAAASAVAASDDDLAWVAIALAGTALVVAAGAAIAAAALWRRAPVAGLAGEDVADGGVELVDRG